MVTVRELRKIAEGSGLETIAEGSSRFGNSWRFADASGHHHQAGYTRAEALRWLQGFQAGQAAQAHADSIEYSRTRAYAIWKAQLDACT